MARKQSNPANSNKPFPAALRTLMKERNTSQKDLAEYLGKTRQAISLYCNGESAPDLEALVKIAQLFDTSADYLLGLYPYPHREPTAVDELGLSPDVVEFLKRELYEEQLDTPMYKAEAGNNGAEYWGTHTAINKVLSHPIMGIVFAQIATTARKMEGYKSMSTPDVFKYHAHYRREGGESIYNFNAAKILTHDLYSIHPELVPFIHIAYGTGSFKLDIDDICDYFRRCVEEVTGYRKPEIPEDS